MAAGKDRQTGPGKNACRVQEGRPSCIHQEQNFHDWNKSFHDRNRNIHNWNRNHRNKNKTMSKPKQDPFLPEDKQPVMECHNCGHFESRDKDGYQDWVRGRCIHTGLTTVPPRHACEAWEKRRKTRKEEE